MNPQARVSVIVTLYNLRRFVREAIESALAQTIGRDALDVVVIDDGSTDGGGEIVQGYGPPVRYLRQPNRGLSAARNAGIRAAHAPYLMFLDADDRVHPEKLALQLAAFDAHPSVGVVYTGWRYVDEAGDPLPQRGWSRQAGNVFPQLVLGNLIHPHVALVRRELVERAGAFDESLTSVEDWDLWLRISRSGALWHCVDRPLADYRIRHDAMHQNPARMLENRLRVLGKIFDAEDVPSEIRSLRPRAYHNAYLTAACDFLRSGERERGARWFGAAVAELPELLGDVKGLRRFCRWLLPQGYQREDIVVEQWRPLTRTLRSVLDDLFRRTDLNDRVRRMRWPAEVAYWRTVLRLLRKRTLARRPMKGETPPEVCSAMIETTGEADREADRAGLS